MAALLQLGIIDEKFLGRPPLQRVNEVVRQKKGSNQCGVFVLAYMEQEVAEAMGCGPAGVGWPWVAAQNRITKMKKMGEQLEIEREKLFHYCYHPYLLWLAPVMQPASPALVIKCL